MPQNPTKSPAILRTRFLRSSWLTVCEHDNPFGGETNGSVNCIMDDVPPLSFSKNHWSRPAHVLNDELPWSWLASSNYNKCPCQALHQWGAFLFYRNMIAYGMHVNIHIPS